MSLSFRRAGSTGIPLAAAIFTLLFLALALAACGGDGGTTTTAASATTTTIGGSGSTPVQVAMKNTSFDPATVTIKVGDTVTWTNQDSARHDVIADNGEFESGLFGKDGTFSFTFTKTGTYPYHCSVHSGMTGTVVVE